MRAPRGAACREYRSSPRGAPRGRRSKCSIRCDPKSFRDAASGAGPARGRPREGADDSERKHGPPTFERAFREEVAESALPLASCVFASRSATAGINARSGSARPDQARRKPSRRGRGACGLFSRAPCRRRRPCVGRGAGRRRRAAVGCPLMKAVRRPAEAPVVAVVGGGFSGAAVRGAGRRPRKPRGTPECVSSAKSGARFRREPRLRDAAALRAFRRRLSSRSSPCPDCSSA